LRPWLLTDLYPDTLQTCFTPARRRYLEHTVQKGTQPEGAHSQRGTQPEEAHSQSRHTAREAHSQRGTQPGEAHSQRGTQPERHTARRGTQPKRHTARKAHSQKRHTAKEAHSQKGTQPEEAHSQNSEVSNNSIQSLTFSTYLPADRLLLCSLACHSCSIFLSPYVLLTYSPLTQPCPEYLRLRCGLDCGTHMTRPCPSFPVHIIAVLQ
jgi:hypothetical protein